MRYLKESELIDVKSFDKYFENDEGDKPEPGSIALEEVKKEMDEQESEQNEEQGSNPGAVKASMETGDNGRPKGPKQVG